MADLLVDETTAASLTAQRDAIKAEALAADAALAAAQHAADAAEAALAVADKARNEAWARLRRFNGGLNSLGAHPEGTHYPTLPETIAKHEIEWFGRDGVPGSKPAREPSSSGGES